MRRSQVVELHFLGFESDPPSYGTLGQPCSLFGSWFPHLLERVISRLCLDIRRIREQTEAQCLVRGHIVPMASDVHVDRAPNSVPGTSPFAESSVVLGGNCEDLGPRTH